ncbi:prepronociceptin b [Synchiropus picturatus]
MKIPLWCLLLLLACLFTPGRCDCQGECVTCGLLLQQQQLHQAFNTMVCLLECEGHVSSSLTWDICERVIKFPKGLALLKREGQNLETTSLHLNSELQSAAIELQKDLDEPEQRSIQYDSSLLESSEEGEGLPGSDLSLEVGVREPRQERDAVEEDEGSEAVTLSKRFGGFQRGRHGYRKLMGSSVRPLQKRYGGFIGVRKSARKWNSQKRVNQLLRQYLGMRSSRSGRFNPVTRVWRQNQL